jgi:peptide/nickel transport system substrate-binding protein
VAERNPYFWKVDGEGNQLPYIDRMRYDILASGEVVAMKGMAGELDLQFYNVNFGDFPTLKDNERAGGYEVYTWRSMGGRSSIAFNLNFTGDPEVADLLKNADFRKALSIAIDRDEVNELAYLGQGNAVQISPPLGAPDYDSSYPTMYADYDPAEAKRMLDEIGLKDTDGDGFRELPSGKKFTLWYITESDLKEYVDTGELVKGYWEDVGVKVDFEPMALDLENQIIDAGEFMCRMSKIDIIVFPLYFNPSDGFMGRFSPTDYRSALQWENWLRNDGSQGERPFPEYQEAHNLFTEIITSTDSGARIAASKKLWENYYDNLWGIGIIQELPFPLIVKNTVKNVPKSAANAWPLRTPSNAGLAQWYLEKE